MIDAIVAAAGTSSRMGARNKMLLPFGDTTVVAHTAGRLVAAGLNVIVVTGFEAEGIAQAVRHLPVRLVRNEHYAQGLGSSLQAGLVAAHGDGYLFCLADMVNITTEEYQQIANAFTYAHHRDSRAICMPRHDNKKGNPVLFAPAYRPELLQQPPSEGFRALIHSNEAHIHWIEMNTPHVLEDMDWPEDYERMKN